MVNKIGVSGLVLVLGLVACQQAERNGPPAPPSLELRGYATCFDGDTCRVNGQPVRIAGMAAPEVPHYGQPGEYGGPQARATMRALVKGRVVTCVQSAQPNNGVRRVMHCANEDGVDLGAAMIQSGWGLKCTYKGYANSYTDNGNPRGLKVPTYCDEFKAEAKE